MPLAPLDPKLKPLALTKFTAPLVYVVFDTPMLLIPVWFPAILGIDAVILPFDNPKLTPLELRNDKPVSDALVFDALTLIALINPAVDGTV